MPLMTETQRSILWMTFAMAVFALGDAGIKALAGRIPPGQIMGTMGLVGTAVFVTIAKVKGQRLFTVALLHPAVILRFFAEMLAGTSMVMALTLAPLTLVTAILQAVPLVVTMGAALLFKEPVGLKRWSAIAIGLVGVFIILRPGSAEFDVTAIWAILAMLGLATRDLATRASPKSVGTLQLGAIGIAGLIPAGLLLFTFTSAPVLPDPVAALLLLFVISVTLLGYVAIINAMRMGAVAAVSPFRYTRLVFGLLLGILLFAERPDAMTYLGAALIVATGLYALYRETRVSR